MNKKILISVVVLLVVVLAWWMSAKKAPAPEAMVSGETINQELDSLNAVDLGAEFQITDSDLESL